VNPVTFRARASSHRRTTHGGVITATNRRLNQLAVAEVSRMKFAVVRVKNATPAVPFPGSPAHHISRESRKSGGPKGPWGAISPPDTVSTENSILLKKGSGVSGRQEGTRFVELGLCPL